MERRNFIIALIAVPALGLFAACGSDAAGDSLQTQDINTAPPSETSAPPAAEPPATTSVDTDAPAESAAAGIVLSYSAPGGFTTVEYAFQDPPFATLTEGGMFIGSPASRAVAPGSLIQQHQVQTVSPAGIEALLAAAEAMGLLAEVDYSSDQQLLVADAPTTVLTITAKGVTYTHEAYALGIQSGPAAEVTESTPQRRALLDFVTALHTDAASIFGDGNVGAPTPYEPQAYQLIATPIGDLSDFEPAPVVEQWPAESGIELAGASKCVEVDRAAVGDLFDTATRLTLFSEKDVTYQVTPRPAYPGRTC